MRTHQRVVLVTILACCIPACSPQPPLIPESGGSFLDAFTSSADWTIRKQSEQLLINVNVRLTNQTTNTLAFWATTRVKSVAFDVRDELNPSMHISEIGPNQLYVRGEGRSGEIGFGIGGLLMSSASDLHSVGVNTWVSLSPGMSTQLSASYPLMELNGRVGSYTYAPELSIWEQDESGTRTNERIYGVVLPNNVTVALPFVEGAL